MWRKAPRLNPPFPGTTVTEENHRMPTRTDPRYHRPRSTRLLGPLLLEKQIVSLAGHHINWLTNWCSIRGHDPEFPFHMLQAVERNVSFTRCGWEKQRRKSETRRALNVNMTSKSRGVAILFFREKMYYCILLFKKTSKINCGNYRGVSMYTILSKKKFLKVNCVGLSGIIKAGFVWRNIFVCNCQIPEKNIEYNSLYQLQKRSQRPWHPDALNTGAVWSSETSINFHQITRRGHLRTRRHSNLKSHLTDEFKVDNIKYEDVSSRILFNFATNRLLIPSWRY